MEIQLDKIIIIAVIGVLLVGPARLPEYARKLASFVKTVRAFTDTAKRQVRDELGTAGEDIDWRQLDPRQYDPRRIIREALLEPSARTPAGNPPADEEARGPAR